MDATDFEDRPAKKRRFFVEDSPIQEHSPDLDQLQQEPVPAPDLVEVEPPILEAATENDGFDVELLNTFVGEQLPESTIHRLRELSQNDIERAVNIYLDGSWKVPQHSLGSIPSRSVQLGIQNPPQSPVTTHAVSSNSPRHVLSRISSSSPGYLGAFGVTGWATRSGLGLITYGEKVRIERARPEAAINRLGIAKKAGRAAAKRQDVVVRFTNSRGEEVGRFENDTAAWISTLIDQQTCSFEGSCVFAPDRVRTNDTIYIQLRCFLLPTAFIASGFVKPETNRQTGLFEVKESVEERELRLRQVALVKLFEEINLHPTSSNEQAEKLKRQGLLQAAENAENRDQQVQPKPTQNGDSSPPNEEAEEGEELEQDQLDTLYKKAQSFDFDTPEAEPASTFVLTLRKYQKQALYWMMGKEKDQKAEHQSMHPLWDEYTWPTKDVDEKEIPQVEGQEKFYMNPYSGEISLDFPTQEQNCLGGVLADEMGLGKTIEMLSLIHTHKTDVARLSTSIGNSVNDLPRQPRNPSSVEWAPVTTLVVAPMSLLAQWQSEAEKASAAGTLNVMVYYGAEKSADLRNLCCEANSSRAPNVIITSYGVILSEFNQAAVAIANGQAYSGLFSLEYFRVILDEAHFIKNRQSKTAKACYHLKARHRWVLTGTPIVNRLEDLFSLVHFLKVEPWSNFSYWKTFITVPFEAKDFIRALDVVQTVLEPLVLRRTKDMKTPDGQALVPLPSRIIKIEKLEFSKPERDVYDFIFTRAKRAFAENVEAGTVLKSYTTIFAQILRLRQTCCHPILTRNKEILAEEEDAAALADLANGLGDDMDLDSLLQRFTAESEEQDANKFGAHVLQQIQDGSNEECPICAEEPMNSQAVTGCWHSACKQCLLDYIQHQQDKGEIPRCFNCREPISSRDVFEVIEHEPETEESDAGIKEIFNSREKATSKPRGVSLRRVGCDASAKVSGLIGHLKKVRKEDSTSKSVVFSQFTSFLDIIEPALTRDRIPFLRFDGTMTQKRRAAVLEEFVNSKKGIVLLLSLRAGGVGLNLTAASRVFMMDPWWSFAVEAQAIDRVHRMGQENEVTVTRFIIEGSIEEKMLRIQDRKKFIASSLGMMSDEEKKLQRIEDIKELLS